MHIFSFTFVGGRLFNFMFLHRRLFKTGSLFGFFPEVFAFLRNPSLAQLLS